MNINRVRLIKREGKSLFIRFSYPDLGKDDFVNRFYERLLAAIIAAEEGFGANRYGACSVRVECTLDECDFALRVLRRVTVFHGTKMLGRAEYVDLFDPEEHKPIFSKKYDKTKKNSIKERKKR